MEFMSFLVKTYSAFKITLKIILKFDPFPEKMLDFIQSIR